MSSQLLEQDFHSLDWNFLSCVSTGSPGLELQGGDQSLFDFFTGCSRNTVGTPQKVRRTLRDGRIPEVARPVVPSSAKGAQLKIIRGGCAFPKTQLSFEFV